MSSVTLFGDLGGDHPCDSSGIDQVLDFDLRKQCLKNPAGLEFVEIEHIRRTARRRILTKLQSALKIRNFLSCSKSPSPPSNSQNSKAHDDARGPDIYLQTSQLRSYHPQLSHFKEVWFDFRKCYWLVKVPAKMAHSTLPIYIGSCPVYTAADADINDAGERGAGHKLDFTKVAQDHEVEAILESFPFAYGMRVELWGRVTILYPDELELARECYLAHCRVEMLPHSIGHGSYNLLVVKPPPTTPPLMTSKTLLRGILSASTKALCVSWSRGSVRTHEAVIQGMEYYLDRQKQHITKALIWRTAQDGPLDEGPSGAVLFVRKPSDKDDFCAICYQNFQTPIGKETSSWRKKCRLTFFGGSSHGKRMSYKGGFV